MSQERHLIRGILAGVAGGLAASWVMNQFIAGPGKTIQKAVQSDEQNQQEEQQQARDKEQGEVKEDATMKAADGIVRCGHWRAASFLGREAASGSHSPLRIWRDHWRRIRRLGRVFLNSDFRLWIVVREECCLEERMS